MGSGVESWPVWVRLYLFGRKKSCCSVLIRGAPAPTHTLTHIYPHTHSATDTHSYTQYGNKPHAKCTHYHMHMHTHQTQLMLTSRSRNVLVVSPRRVVSRVCVLLNISSYIAGRRYPDNISFKSRLNYTCGVLRSFNFSGLCDSLCVGMSLALEN